MNFSLIPWYYKALASIGVIVGIWFAGDLHGSHKIKAEWDQSNNLATIATQAIVIDSDKLTLNIAVDSAAQIQTIYVHGATITKEIPKYVTVKDDANCTINNGFVSLWNAAATGSDLPDTASQSNAAGSGIALSTVADAYVVSATRYRAVAEQLRQLQVWVREQAALYAPPTRSAVSDRAK